MALDQNQTTADEVRTPPMGGFELIMDTSFAQGNAAVKMQWCIAPDLLLQIAASGQTLHDAHIFLATSSGRGIESRYVFKVSDMEAIVNFTRPGTNWIFAYLSYLPDNNIETLKRRFYKQHKREEWGYYFLEWDEDDTPFVPDRNRLELLNVDWDNKRKIAELNNHLIPSNQSIEVDVDPTFFAKEWSPNMEWWISLWEKYEPSDQCDRRKQYAIAFTIQPIIISVWLVYRTIITLGIGLIAFLCAERGFSPKAILHPFTYPDSDTWDNLDEFGSLVYQNKDGENRPGATYLWIFIPILTLALGLVMFSLSLILATIFGSTALMTIFGATMIAGYLLGSYLAGDSGELGDYNEPKSRWNKYFVNFQIWTAKRNQAKIEKVHQQRQKMLAQMADELTCAPEMRLRDSSQLPNAKRRMLYNTVKQAVCKPIAKKRRFRG